jgi:hypothetical protein
MLALNVLSVPRFALFTTLALLSVADTRLSAATNETQGWFAFAPRTEKFGPESGFNLRSLNEAYAGQGGFIGIRDGQFVHSETGLPLRFWAVNGPPADLKDRKALRDCGRLLAKYGVNMVRIHGGYYDQSGVLEPEKVQHTIDVVEAMKPSGVYSHLSMAATTRARPPNGRFATDRPILIAAPSGSKPKSRASHGSSSTRLWTRTTMASRR